MKLIIGAGQTNLEGWYSTQMEELNLLHRDDFKRILVSKASAMLAEHVFEHLTLDEGRVAAKNCFDFLEPGGYIRVAVPDRNFRNEWYQNMVKVGGDGDQNHPAFTHKIVYDYKQLVDVFTSVGFVVELLEYCDENGVFHYHYWNEKDGLIGRSYRFDTRNDGNQLGMVSIIIDAKKPLTIGS